MIATARTLVGLSGLIEAALIHAAAGTKGSGRMTRLIVVRATWDDEAKVWVAQSTDLPGLVTEAESLNALDEKLPGLIQDLLEDDGEVACCRFG